jgi:hypothetical protein
MRNDIYASFPKLHQAVGQVLQVQGYFPRTAQWPSRPPSA